MRLEMMTEEDVDLRILEETDPRMMAELGGPRPREDIERAHAKSLALAAEGTCWPLKVIPDGSDAAAGGVAIFPSSHEGETIYEIGWMTLPEFQNQGIAGQAVREVLEKARAERKFGQIHAFPAVTNGASNRIAERNGFTNLGACDIEFSGRTLHCNHWRIDLFSAFGEHRSTGQGERGDEERDAAGRGPVSQAPASKPRGIAFRVLAFLFGAGSLGGLFGIGIVIGWFDTDEAGIHRVHDIGFGVLYGIVVAAAFFAMTRRPESKPSAVLQVAVTALAVAIAALKSVNPAYLIIAAALIAAAGILLALHPTRDEVLHPRMDPSPLLGALVVTAAIPLVWFGLTAARLQRTGSPADPHVQMGHWTTMASMAFGLVLVGLLASLRIRGWRFTAWCAGLGAAAYGLASAVFDRYPGTTVPYAGSEGAGWGAVAALGGLVFIAAAEWEARRSRRVA